VVGSSIPAYSLHLLHSRALSRCRAATGLGTVDAGPEEWDEARQGRQATGLPSCDQVVRHHGARIANAHEAEGGEGDRHVGEEGMQMEGAPSLRVRSPGRHRRGRLGLELGRDVQHRFARAKGKSVVQAAVVLRVCHQHDVARHMKREIPPPERPLEPNVWPRKDDVRIVHPSLSLARADELGSGKEGVRPSKDICKGISRIVVPIAEVPVAGRGPLLPCALRDAVVGVDDELGFDGKGTEASRLVELDKGEIVWWAARYFFVAPPLDTALRHEERVQEDVEEGRRFLQRGDEVRFYLDKGEGHCAKEAVEGERDARRRRSRALDAHHGKDGAWRVARGAWRVRGGRCMSE